MIHLTVHQLSSFLDAELPESSKEIVRRHLEGCPECEVRFSALVEQEETLNRIMVHDPGDAFFASFADLVLRPEEAAPAPAQKPRDRRAEPDRRVADRRVVDRRVTPDRRGQAERLEPKPLIQWKPRVEPSQARERQTAAPPPVAPVAPTPFEAVEPFASAQPVAPPPVAPPEPVHAETVNAPATRPRHRSQPAVPWSAAAVLCVLVGAIAYVIPRPAGIFGGADRTQREEPAATPNASAPPQREGGDRRPSSRNADPAPASVGEIPLRETAGVDAGAQGPEERTETPTPAEQTVESPPSGPAPSALSREPVEARAPLADPESEPLRTLSPPEKNVVPVRKFVTTTEVAPERPKAATPVRPPAAKPRPDEFASAPMTARPFIAEAQKAARAASLDSSAANLDAAADAWERAIPKLDGPQRVLARHRLAEARYRAWSVAPDPYRVAAARAALRAYLVFAPSGPERDAAKSWLARIGG